MFGTVRFPYKIFQISLSCTAYGTYSKFVVLQTVKGLVWRDVQIHPTRQPKQILGARYITIVVAGLLFTIVVNITYFVNTHFFHLSICIFAQPIHLNLCLHAVHILKHFLHDIFVIINYYTLQCT